MSESEPTGTLAKKRKLPAQNDAERPTKKSKRDGTVKKKKKDKANDGTEFQAVMASVVVSIPPIFANRPKTGVLEMLDSMVMRYIPAFRGVVLSHSNLRFLEKAAIIKADCPFSVCTVGFDATVWRPHVRMKLVGKVNLCSPDHISLLVHRTFNASIPRLHIPTDEWEFEYGPAENDPEFGPDAQGDEKSDNESPDKRDGETGGKWIHKVTGDTLGGTEGFLEFTVIGLTVANEMLSLLGSIQADPFSPTHTLERILSTKTSKFTTDDQSEQTKADAFPDEYSEDEDDVDTFQQLGRQADEAAAQEAKRKTEEAELMAKAKKRKRKSEKGDTKAKEGEHGGKKAKKKKT